MDELQEKPTKFNILLNAAMDGHISNCFQRHTGTHFHDQRSLGLCPNYLSTFTFNTTVTAAMSQTGFIMVMLLCFFYLLTWVFRPAYTHID